MSDSQYLQIHGWRQIGVQRGAKLWDHPSHQPSRRGAFTTTNAVRHQKRVIKEHACDCIKPEGL